MTDRQNTGFRYLGCLEGPRNVLEMVDSIHRTCLKKNLEETRGDGQRDGSGPYSVMSISFEYLQ
jgi:hypothetical protein